MVSKVLEKVPFDIDIALSRIEKRIEPFPKAALFELAEEGHTSVFEQLVACIISIRTYDETMLPVARNLFQKARTPQQVIDLSVAEIDSLISESTFHEPKAQTIHDIARRAVEEWGGELPCDENALLSLKGVGPKCANLVLGIACGIPKIGVDIHVHRVTNRWGYVAAKTPEKTLLQLQKVLPERHHVAINRLLVPFGKHICTGTLPKCSTCLVLDMCQQVGVEKHR
jgi:endonuclease-3